MAPGAEAHHAPMLSNGLCPPAPHPAASPAPHPTAHPPAPYPLLLTLLHLTLSQADFRNLPRRATASGSMVASDNSRCSQIGRDVLHSGGNAVDAAVTVALCLGVVNPVSSGLGGGAFITIRLANGTAAFFDARETAPAAATEDMFTGEGGWGGRKRPGRYCKECEGVLPLTVLHAVW